MGLSVHIYGLLTNTIELYIPLRMLTFPDLTFQMLKPHPGNSLKFPLFVPLDKFPKKQSPMQGFSVDALWRRYKPVAVKLCRREMMLRTTGSSAR